VDRLEHRVLIANVRTSRRSDTALDLRRFIRDDIAIEIGQQKYLEFTAARKRISFVRLL
jgi:hypothetical protein